MFVLADGRPTADDRAAAYALKAAISARGPLWALLPSEKASPCRRQVNPDPCAASGAGLGDRHRPAGGAIAAIEQTMRAAGLDQIPAGVLDAPAPDHETQLDGAPATVREVLFCEIC